METVSRLGKALADAGGDETAKMSILDQVFPHFVTVERIV
jgi:hypothetical protein